MIATGAMRLGRKRALNCSVKIQAKSTLEILILAIPCSPVFREDSKAGRDGQKLLVARSVESTANRADNGEASYGNTAAILFRASMPPAVSVNFGFETLRHPAAR